MLIISIIDSLRGAPINSLEFKFAIEYFRALCDNGKLSSAEEVQIRDYYFVLRDRLGENGDELKRFAQLVGPCAVGALFFGEIDIAIKGNPSRPLGAVRNFIAEHLNLCDDCAGKFLLAATLVLYPPG